MLREPLTATTLTVPRLPGTVAAIGRIVSLTYESSRGRELWRYTHAFKPGARPVLAVAPDGRQLFLIGGRFRFTRRGIVDS